MKWFTKKNKVLPPLEAVLPDTDQKPEIDIFSPTWKFVRAWAEAQLKDTRERNDSLKRTETETAAIRGEIRKLKEILALPDKKWAGNTPGILNTAFNAGKEQDNE